MIARRVSAFVAVFAFACVLMIGGVSAGAHSAWADGLEVRTNSFYDVVWTTPVPDAYPIDPTAKVMEDHVDVSAWWVYKSGDSWYAVSDYETFAEGTEYGIMFYATPTDGYHFAEGMSGYLRGAHFSEYLIAYDHDTGYAKWIYSLGACSTPVTSAKLLVGFPYPGVSQVFSPAVTVQSGDVTVGSGPGERAYIYYFSDDYYTYTYMGDTRVPAGYQYGFVGKVVAPEGKQLAYDIDLKVNYVEPKHIWHFGSYAWVEFQFAESNLIKRISGDYANETAAAIAHEFCEESQWAIIARDDDFADALGASGLAGALYAPIVLTDRNSLSPAAAQTIKDLGVTHAYIIGGTGAISTQVDDDLKALGVDVEPRIWGENSYDTSLECAEKILEITGYPTIPLAFVAMSMNFQDALSASSIAYVARAPIVLQTWGDTAADRGFTEEAHMFIEGNADKVVVLGGTGAISDASVNGLPVTDRLWGETGYQTSERIAIWGLNNNYLQPRVAVIACGAQAPMGVDALAGSALAGKYGAPILLVNGNEEMEEADLTTITGLYTQMANAGVLKYTYVLGGEYVVPEELFLDLTALNHAVDLDNAAG